MSVKAVESVLSHAMSMEPQQISEVSPYLPLADGTGTKKNFSFGTHRLVDPSETYQKISEKFPLMGITRIADVTGLDEIGIPVCMAVRPNSKSLSVSQGKGVSLMAAKVSAAMESIESFHAENIRKETLWASYDEMIRSGLKACDPQTLNLNENSIYHPDLQIKWILGFDLIQNAEVFVPYDMVRLDFLSEPEQWPIFKQSSNGLASGNHILEAISHALCEVVERDSTALWKVHVSLPENVNSSYIDLETIDSPLISEVLRKLEDADVKVLISNQTSNVGIPAFGCDLFTINAVTPSTLPTYSGYGCHLSKEVAILRAVTEAVQSRLTLIAGSRDDLIWTDYQEMFDGVSRSAWHEQLQKIKPETDYRLLPSLETDNLAGDVKKQLSLLQQAGFESVIAVDLTKSEIGISVAKVIIPRAEFGLDDRGYPNQDRFKKHIIRKLMQLLEG